MHRPLPLVQLEYVRTYVGRNWLTPLQGLYSSGASSLMSAHTIQVHNQTHNCTCTYSTYVRTCAPLTCVRACACKHTYTRTHAHTHTLPPPHTHHIIYCAESRLCLHNLSIHVKMMHACTYVRRYVDIIGGFCGENVLEWLVCAWMDRAYLDHWSHPCPLAQLLSLPWLGNNWRADWSLSYKLQPIRTATVT